MKREQCEEDLDERKDGISKLARATSRGDLWPGVSKKEYIFDPSDFRRLRLHEAIFKGSNGEQIISPAKIFLKPYWKERGGSYFEEEGRRVPISFAFLDSADFWLLTPGSCLSHFP